MFSEMLRAFEQAFNVNGIRGQHDQHKHLLATNTGFNVLAINETKVEYDLPNQIIDIDGYKIERKDRTSRGGVVAVYLRDHLIYTVRRDIVDYGLELICVEIRPLRCRPIIIVAWYRPPSDPVSSFELLEKVLSFLDREDKEIILIGDTNCDFSDRAIDSDFYSINLLNICDLFSFKQPILEPTRESLGNKIIFDHIATNFQRNIIHHGVIRVSMSDHYLVYYIRKLSGSLKRGHKIITTRVMKRFSEKIFWTMLLRLPRNRLCSHQVILTSYSVNGHPFLLPD